jgi:1-phosphofructokinase family hexose kinase
VIVTVTLNVAIDRTLTVPNFQLGQRHRASEWLTLAGGKGINVARALKALDVPVVATGLAGGRTGMRVVEELQNEAILNDLVQIADESRTSTVVIDDIPLGMTVTEIYEWGPNVSPEELDILTEKLRYLSRSAGAVVVFAGSLPRGVDPGFYGEAIRDLNRRGVKTVLDAEGLPLRLGVEAEPFLVTPNQREAEGLVGQEFHDPDDFVMALDAIADIGARNVVVTHETGCFALFREDRRPQRFLAFLPRLDPRSNVGSGDVLLAAFLASRLVEGKPIEDALRNAVAAGAASTQTVGAGRFDPREVARILASVELEELTPVGSGR